MTLRTELVSTPARLMEIGPAWDALWQRSEQSVFQSHGWVAAWCGSRQTDDMAPLCVGLCWAEDRLVAVMPLAMRRHRGVSVLEWAAKDCSDYCDAVVEPAFPESRHALEQVWAAVVASGQFDLAYLSHVRPDAALHVMLDGQQQSMKLRPGHRSARSLQVQRDGADGHTWFSSLSQEARNSHARGMTALNKIGPVAASLHRAGHLADTLLDRMIELKQQWLAKTGQSSSILDNDAAILRALVQELARQDALQLFSMQCGDHLVAAMLSIAIGTRTQTFFSAFDPHFDNAEPEMLMMVEYLIKAFDSGVTEVDLLCVEAGNPFSFAKTQVNLTSYVGARTLVGKLALAVLEGVDRARGWSALPDSTGTAATR